MRHGPTGFDEFDDEIRGHMALSMKERIEDGEDPEAARLAALREFGNVTLTRESMRAVWRPRWLELAGILVQDFRIALRSLHRARGLAVAVIVTLALGIGANAAVFSVVREVLLRPLVNQDAHRLLYIRQSAAGLGAENMTFSVPEVRDLQSRMTTISSFGDFSTVEFTLLGLGEPRAVKAGVVGGSFFGVMGLHPALGRLLDQRDDGPDASGAAVLTHRFWSASLEQDPAVIGKSIRLGSRTATIVGVLEPSVPYPVDTELIANIVTSPHHLDATMVTDRTHRMTELFGRLAAGATIEEARTELATVHAGMMRAHPESYAPDAGMQLTAAPLREQITAPARTILLMLLAAAAVVFAIACSNVANLILARTVRRERELMVRAALGASSGALRRTLLAESLVLCGAGAALGVLLARPLVDGLSRFTARLSPRAIDVSVDGSVLWVGAGLALVAAIVLAYVPRLPSAAAPSLIEPPGNGIRITPGTKRRLQAFAITQIAFSFLLLAGAGSLLATVLSLRRAATAFDIHRVLALDIPMPLEVMGPKAMEFLEEATRRIETLPGVQRVVAGSFVPWRDAGSLGVGAAFAVDEDEQPAGREKRYGRPRMVAPGFFAALGVPMIAGRDFADDDGRDSELVVIVSQSLAQQVFHNGDALNRHLWWTDSFFGKRKPRRIVGIVADADDERIVAGPALTVYHPVRQVPFANRLFVNGTGDLYALVPDVTRIIHEISAEQPVGRAATLADVRAEVLAPEQLNAVMLSGFAGVAVLVAVVGIAGVLAFSVSARTREFGVLLAMGSTPGRLMTRVLAEGAVIVTIGIALGAAGGYVLGYIASGYIDPLRLADPPSALAAAAVLAGAAILASLMPAARASRVDVSRALRSE